MPVPTTQHSSSEDKLHSLHSDDWALSIWINFTLIQNTIGNGWKIFTPLCIPSPAGRAYTLFPPPTMKFFQYKYLYYLHLNFLNLLLKECIEVFGLIEFFFTICKLRRVKINKFRIQTKLPVDTIHPHGSPLRSYWVPQSRNSYFQAGKGRTFPIKESNWSLDLYNLREICLNIFPKFFKNIL